MVSSSAVPPICRQILDAITKKTQVSMIYTCVTPQNRHYADFSDPAQIRIITILGRPPDITCTPKHARYVGGL